MPAKYLPDYQKVNKLHHTFYQPKNNTILITLSKFVYGKMLESNEKW